MKVEFTFLHVDSSDALKTRALEKLEKIDTFEHKPMDINIIISQFRQDCLVEINVLEGRRKFQSTGVSNDFYKSLDKAVEKLKKQLSKGKRRMKQHKHHDHIHNLYELNGHKKRDLEYEFEEEFNEIIYKKSA